MKQITRMEYLRRIKGMSQRELAKETKIPLYVLSALESNTVKNKLKEFFGVEFDELIKPIKAE